MINKYQQGGSAQQQLMKFIEGIAQVLKADINQITQAAQQNPEALKQAVGVYQQTQDIQQAAQAFAQAFKQTQTMRQGAKLNYIKSLKSICKEGEELVYMKAGGKVCPVCQKKQVQSEKKGGAVDEFKAKRLKCGGKSKKMETGGFISKVGDRVKQTINDSVNSVKKPYKKTVTPTRTYDKAKHDRLIKEYQRNGRKLPKEKMDSLQWYNRHDPNEEGV